MMKLRKNGRKFKSMFFFKIISKPFRMIYQIYVKSQFRLVGEGTNFDRLLRVQGGGNISIHDHVHVHRGTWLAAISLNNSSVDLCIDSGCIIGYYNHIFATGKIVIGKNVITAKNVYISDNLHSYEDIDIPIYKQPIKQLKNIFIGEGSWIGENACIIGSSIGKHCVVGANAVVTHDVPDYSVVVGAPARVIKYFDFNKKMWVSNKN